MAEREMIRDTESGRNVAGLLFHREASLGAGAARADEEVRPAPRGGIASLRDNTSRGGQSPAAPPGGHAGGEGKGEDFGLVVAAGPPAGPVEGNGNDEVHIGKMWDGSETAAQEGAVESTCGEVSMIFQGTGDTAVWTFVVHQGGGVGIVHPFRAAVTFQDGVETVGHRVVGLKPEAGVGHIGRAREAQVPLTDAQAASAYDARPG